MSASSSADTGPFFMEMRMGQLIHIVTTALGLFFWVGFIRACPWPVAWLQRKPLGCHYCMVGWLIIFAGLARGIDAVPSLVAAGGLAAALLTWEAKVRGQTGTVLQPPDLS